MDLLRRAGLRLQIHIDRSTDAPRAFLPQIHREQEDWERVWLDLIDAILYELESRRTAPRIGPQGLGQPPLPPSHARALNETLELSGSTWRVDLDSNARLERRVDATVQDAVARSVETSTATNRSASEHLRLAWQAAYGRQPDPTAAYSQAIKAVESAAAPMVTPNDTRATLGTILRELSKPPARWTFAIQPGARDVVVAMMKCLWEGQVDRHGGITPTPEVTQDAAEAAVHMAVTLVHWFTGGAVRGAN
jgi:hypothetical protein